MNYKFRPATGESDYASMRSLVVEIEARIGPLVYCHLGDLDWWRFSSADPQAALHAAGLWYDDADELVAFCWPGAGQVEIITHPGHPEVDSEILVWAEQRCRETAADERPSFTAWSFEHHESRNEMLRQRGYQRQAAHFNVNARMLDSVPQPVLPPGYRIRNVQGEADLERRVAVHRDAFSPSRMTIEKHRAVMSAPTYRPELDLVVEAPDGSFAAYCLVWLDAANRTGEFEPVGCHSAHRRRGLTRAVLFEGMRRLREYGAERCSVISSGAESFEPSRRLYAAAGFERVGQVFSWTTTLQPSNAAT